MPQTTRRLVTEAIFTSRRLRSIEPNLPYLNQSVSLSFEMKDFGQMLRILSANPVTGDGGCPAGGRRVAPALEPTEARLAPHQHISLLYMEIIRCEMYPAWI